MTINEIQEEIISDLADLEIMEKYEYLINLGKKLPKIDEQNKIEQNKIMGCQSRAWIFEIPQIEQTEKHIKIPQNLEKLEQDILCKKLNKSLNQPNLEKLSDYKINQNQSDLEKKLFFSGFSDSQIVVGLLGLLWKIFNGQNKSEILKCELFLTSRISFDELLTVRRREGFWQIYDRILAMCKG